MIYAAESIAELDSILYKYRKRLRPASIGAAMVKLEALSRYERSPPYALKVQAIAGEVEKYVETFVDRLALTQVANVVRGMSSVRHRLPSELLVRLAAGVVGDGGLALRYAPDVDVRDLAFGFAGQGFVNPLFWSRLSAALLPRLPSLDPNTLPAILRALAAAQQLPAAAGAGAAEGGDAAASPSASAAAAGGDAAAALGSDPRVAFAREALRLLAGSLDRLQPARLADAALALAQLGPVLGLPEGQQAAEALQAAASRALPSLGPGPLSNVLLSLLALRRATGAAPAALPQQLAAAAVPHLAAAAPALQLVHIKRAVEALAPSLANAAAAQGMSPAPPALLDLLARRALQLLPSADGAAAGAATLPLSGGLIARLPRGGKDAAAALAAAAGPAAAVDPALLGMCDGLARAFAAAAPAVPADGGAAGSGVQVLAARIGQLAAAGQERGLLMRPQAVSLGQSLEKLGAGEAARALIYEKEEGTQAVEA